MHTLNQVMDQKKISGEVELFPCPTGAEDHLHYVCHKTDGDVELGAAYPLKDGEALPHGAKEIVVMEQQKSGRYAITDRISLHGGAGPAQVATSGYRSNYERIFGRQPIGQA